MATAATIKKNIAKLEAALKSKATPKTLKPKLEAQLVKSKAELSGINKGTKPKTSSTKSTQTALQKLKEMVNKNKKFKNYKGAGVDLEKDADRPALKTGKRTAKKSGNTYYEYRANRIDVKQPSKTARYPKLEQGGYMADGGELGNWYKEGSDKWGLEKSDTYIKENDGKYELYLRTFDNKINKWYYYLSETFDSLEDAKKSGYGNSLYAKGGYMAKGGKVSDLEKTIIKTEKSIEYFQKEKENGNEYADFALKSLHNYLTELKDEQANSGNKYAKGGEINTRMLNKKIKDWYIKTYPTDDLGEEINDTITFKSFWGYTKQGYDPYEVLYVGDSVIRERVEQKLSEILSEKSGYMADGGEVGGRGWSNYEKGDRIKNISELKVGQSYLEYNKQFNSKNIIRITSGDKTSLNRDIVYAGFVRDKNDTRIEGDFAIWGSTLDENEIYEIKESKMAKGGYMADGGYVAVSETKDGYWVVISRPTTKESAEEMADSLREDNRKVLNEETKVVTLEEAKAHKKIIGKEYLEKGGYMAKGGALEHGLMVGDTVRDVAENSVAIYNVNNRKSYVVDLDKGTRTEWMIGSFKDRRKYAERGAYMEMGGEIHRTQE